EPREGPVPLGSRHLPQTSHAPPFLRPAAGSPAFAPRSATPSGAAGLAHRKSPPASGGRRAGGSKKLRGSARGARPAPQEGARAGNGGGRGLRGRCARGRPGRAGVLTGAGLAGPAPARQQPPARPSDAAAPPAPLTLADLEEMAAKHNPTLVQAAANVEAAR